MSETSKGSTSLRWIKTRIYICAALMSIFIIAIAWKAYGLQIVENDRFVKLAQKQHLRTLEIPAPRGFIYDAENRVLATTVKVESVIVNPREVVDVAGSAAALADLLDLDRRTLEAKLSADGYFQWIKRRVTSEEASHVRELNSPGIDFVPEYRRFYPSESLGGTVIGFSNIDGLGIEGIEKGMNDLLTGTNARMSALRDARGNMLISEGTLQPKAGYSVSLTLDRSIQYISERALKEAVDTHKAKSGIAIVLDVKTSKVLSMASFPNYDPNNPARLVARGARNRSIADAYEIGSLMKIFTVGAALENGAVTEESWFSVKKGYYRVGRKLITDSLPDKFLQVGGCLKRSSNICTVKIAQRLGKEKLHKSLLKYGFGKKTGIELPGERSGFIRSPTKWGEIGLATVSFGYGLLVTPLQVAAALAAVGNDGVFHEPRIIREVRSSSGKVVFSHDAPSKKIMERKTARSLRKMLASVFDKGKKGGTARKINVLGYKAGGKTGTAYKVDPKTGRYNYKMYLSSFAGLVPIDDPKIAVVVVIDEPSGKEHYGSKVAGPAFAKIASETLKYLDIPSDPSREKEDQSPKRESVRVNIEADVIPPSVMKDLLENSYLEGENKEIIEIPNFKGMTIAQAVSAAKNVGIQLEIEGEGRAKEQTLAPGSARKGSTCKVLFGPRIVH